MKKALHKGKYCLFLLLLYGVESYERCSKSERIATRPSFFKKREAIFHNI